MQIPLNGFKRALYERRAQIGLWVGSDDSAMAELLAGAGFHGLVFDTEHSPQDPRSVLRLLQAVAPYPVHSLVRPLTGAAELIKQYLDIGAQSLVVPMIETPEQAALVVAATRYPPRGNRGVASATTRASRWNRIEEYAERADEQMCVLVQVESVRGLDNLEAIAAVDGVDGIFFGPADLAASMGLLGKPADSSVRKAILEGIERVNRLGRAAGTLTLDREHAREYLAAGALFVAVGVDMALLARAAQDLAASFK